MMNNKITIADGYKNSKVGVIPLDWEIVKLLEISKITMGQSPSSESYNDKKIGTPLIQGNADCKNRKTLPRNYTTEKTKECFIGDIIMTVRAPVGAISNSLHNACIGRGVCAIKSKSNNKFLYHFLVDCEKRWEKYSQGSTFTAVNSKDVKNLKIPLPPLKEQQKIAEFLTTWDEAISMQNDLIKAKEELKKGLMQKLLSGEVRFDGFVGEWKEVRLKEVLKSNKLGGNYKNSLEISNNPLIKMGNIKRGQINIKKIEYILNKEPLINEHLIKYGDLFFNTRNTLDLVGKVAIWRNELDRAFYNSNLMKLVFNEKIESNFFMNYLFNTEKVLVKLKSYATGTTSVAAIYTKDLLNLKIKLPPLQEQQKIAEVLSNTDKEIELLKNELDALKEQKKGLMQKLLSGEIRVKNA